MMKFSTDSIFKHKRDHSLMTKSAMFPEIRTTKKELTKSSFIKNENSEPISKEQLENPSLHLTSHNRHTKHLLAVRAPLLSKDFIYNSNYNYYETQKIIKEDLCFQNLQILKTNLPLPMFKLPRILNKELMRNKSTPLISIQQIAGKSVATPKTLHEKEHDLTVITTDSQKVQSTKVPYPIEISVSIPNFAIDALPFNENPIPTRMQFSMHYNQSKLFLIGGFGRKMFPQCLIYDTVTQKMLVFKNSFFKRARHISVKLGPLIIVHGGVTLENYSNRFTMSDAFMFDTRLLTRKSQCFLDKASEHRNSSSQKIPHRFFVQRAFIHTRWAR